MVILLDKTPLTLSNVPAKFPWDNQNRLGEKYKNTNFYRLKLAAILWNLEHAIKPKFCTALKDHPIGTCMQNIIGISVMMRALQVPQRFDNIFWILRQQRLQHYQEQLGPTLYAGPKNITGQIHSKRTMLIKSSCKVQKKPESRGPEGKI